MKTAGQNPSAGISGTAHRTVSKGGYVGVLASKFYAGYKRRGEQVTITWNATTVTLTDAPRNDHRYLRQAHRTPRLARARPDKALHEVMRHAPVHDVPRHERARSPETSHSDPDYTLDCEEHNIVEQTHNRPHPRKSTSCASWENIAA